MENLSFGVSDRTWEQYGLVQSPIFFKENATKYKAIIRNDSLIAILGRRYELLPNEEALRIADQTAEMCSLKQKEVRYNNESTRMHAIYQAKESYDVAGDKMFIGVDVWNAIDGTSGFGVSAFNFRQTCSNGVVVANRGYVTELTGEKIAYAIRHKHTKSLTDELRKVEDAMRTIMDKNTLILQAYQEMTERKFTEALCKKIKETELPKKIVPAYIQEPQSTLFSDGITEWVAYNDITANIWHSKSEMTTKVSQYTVINRIMIPSLR